MSSPHGFPLALKVFFTSLVVGVGGGYGAFRVASYLALKFLKGEYAEPLAMLIGFAAALLVGVCSAVTAGVLAGRTAQSKGVQT